MRANYQNSIGGYGSKGFTLVEMIVVIAIIGILGGIITVFVAIPVQGYVDSARRAELSDAADTVLLRLARDIRTAVPNSVRLTGTSYIEFLPTKAGGRYRATELTPAGSLCPALGNTSGDALSFAGDSCFEILGPQITFAAGDQIVINSTQLNGNPPYDNTATGIRRAYNSGAGGVGAKSIVVMDATPFPAGFNTVLPGQRFDVIPGDQQAVTYACENVGTSAEGDGTGTLKRYWGYGFNAVQVAPPSGGSNALLADKVSQCEILYDAATQLVSVTLTITRSNEYIKLFQKIHVNNMP